MFQTLVLMMGQQLKFSCLYPVDDFDREEQLLDDDAPEHVQHPPLLPLEDSMGSPDSLRKVVVKLVVKGISAEAVAAGVVEVMVEVGAEVEVEVEVEAVVAVVSVVEPQRLDHEEA